MRDEFAELGLRGRLDTGGLHLKGTLEDGWTIVLNSRLASGLRLRVWQGEVKGLCRGAGRGRLHPREEIEAAMRLKAEHDRELEAE